MGDLEVVLRCKASDKTVPELKTVVVLEDCRRPKSRDPAQHNLITSWTHHGHMSLSFLVKHTDRQSARFSTACGENTLLE